MTSPARVRAYEMLRSVERGGDLPAALADARRRLPDRRDAALASEIVLGVLRHRGAIDHLLAHVAKRPVDRLDREVLTILRLSAYQLLHLTRVPASAVVDDGVRLTRQVRKSSAAPLVNAVLRTLSRTRRDLPLPAKPVDGSDRLAALDYLSITLSHPRWLAERWHDRFGLDGAEAWMRFNNEPAPVTVRANPLWSGRDALVALLTENEIAVRPGQYAPGALVVTAGELLGDDRIDPRTYVVQDEASQLIPLLAGRDPGRLVLDACASPGGKTTALAAAAPGSRIVAADVRSRRMALLARAVALSGADNVRLVQADLLAPLPFRAPFDCVIVDAPCSGLGTLRRDPDIRWRRAAADLPRFAAAQGQMLQHAGAIVGPGGRLVYATCSSEAEENEDVAAAFLAAAPHFTPVHAGRVHPDLPPAVVDERGHLRTRPDRHGLAAFFGAVFERRG